MVYEISIEPGGFSFQADSESPILSQALAQDIDFAFGCQGGACGTCKVKKTAGKISYPDNELPPALDEEEHQAGFVLCCQATAESPLTLEIPSIGANKQRILTLPVRLLEKRLSGAEEILLSLKLPGTQEFPALDGAQTYEILGGPGQSVFATRTTAEKLNVINLELRAEPENNYITYLFEGFGVGEMIRIRGPI